MKDLKAKQYKILFAVYDNYTHDERAMETIRALKKIGKLIVVSYEKNNNDSEIKSVITGNGKRKYLSYKKELKKAYTNHKPDVVFLHDYYNAFFIKWLKKHNQKVVIGYDSSELYIDRGNYKSINGIKQKLLIKQELKNLNKADFIIAANIERAQIMKKAYNLNEIPAIIDNVHKICDEIDYKICEEKYGKLFEKNVNAVLYCGGISEARCTFKLVEAIEELGKNYKLIIAGQSTNENRERLSKIYEKSKTKNFTYIGYISRSELKYLLQKSKISISAFDMNNVNNKYCASGKIYESIFENTPILTSENPPLKRICDEYKIGISTHNFKNGIIEIVNNYDYYVNNVIKYKNSLNYKDRSKMIENKIRKLIESSINE